MPKIRKLHLFNHISPNCYTCFNKLIAVSYDMEIIFIWIQLLSNWCQRCNQLAATYGAGSEQWSGYAGLISFFYGASIKHVRQDEM